MHMNTDAAKKHNLYQLDRERCARVAPWFEAIDGAEIRLASILEKGGGSVYADCAENPSAAFMLADDGFGYLAGEACEAFAGAAVDFLMECFLPRRPAGDRQVILFSGGPAWKESLDRRLAPSGGFRIRRHAFAFDAGAFGAAAAALPPLPAGYEARGLASGRFDSGIFFGAEEAAHCREAFSGAGKCELQVFTAEPHRRKGLALHACAAFIGKCVGAGMTPHWSCWDYNAPSVALAEKLGFRRLADLEVNFCDLG